MTATVTLTRQELYDKVWETPMVKLAAEWGLSGRGLAKLCERHGIPVPGRGHWALERAGFAMERDPLPAEPPPETQVTIVGEPSKEKEEHPIVAAQIAYERDHPIAVPDHLTRPHSLVAQAKDALRPRVPESYVAVRRNPLPARVSAKQIPRALRIFDAFFKACEDRGFAVKAKKGEDGRDEGVRIVVHGEEIAVGLDEANQRSDHVLTAREESERQKGRGWMIPQYDYTPSGNFTFTIHEYTEGLRHRWSDRKKRNLDSCLNDIMVALVRISVTILQPRRMEAARRHQEWLEEERRRRIYWARMDALNEALKKWQESQELRLFVAAVDEAAQKRLGTIPENSPIKDWISWARAVADRIDPLDGFIDSLGSAPPD